MSGFRRGFHCANLAIVRVHQSYRALPRLSRIARAHDRGSRLRHRLDAPRLHHICAAKLETCRQRSHPLVSAANALHPYPTVTTTAIGPVRDLEAALNGPLDLVATSALLDLVSYSWFKRLAIGVAVRGLPFYAALSYNGQVTFEPSDPLDAPITAAVSTTNVATRDWDQHSARMPRTIELFEAVGYFVGCAATDWDEATRSGHAGGSSPRLAGYGALGGATVAARNRISAHASARCAVARKSSIRVGRIDVLAAPTARR
jgi:hypothetical protein